MRSKIYQVVSLEFSENFPERNVQIKQQFGKMSNCIVKKVLYSLNRNSGRSGRRRTARSEENIENVRQLLHDTHVTGRRNPLQISQVTFHEDL